MVRFDPRNEAAAVVEFAPAELNVKSVKLLNNGTVDQFVEVDQLPELEPVHVWAWISNLFKEKNEIIKSLTKDYKNNFNHKTLKKFNGRVVKKDNNTYLASFKSVTDTVLCALKIQFHFKYVTPKADPSTRKLNIALSSGIPITNKENIFEEAITLATRMCDIVKEQLVITTEVKLLYESENRNAAIDNKMIKICQHFLFLL